MTTNSIDDDIEQAWLMASEELGIHVQAPFVLETATRIFQFEALIHDFGTSRGTIVGTSSRRDGITECHDLGFAYSALGPAYRYYERRLFADTLNDWQWRGDPSAKPKWYTGAVWN